MKLNGMQLAVLKDYGDGDFAHHATQEELSQGDLNGLGDSLLYFILVELSDKEDCESVDMGIQRLNTAQDELDVCLVALTALQAAMETAQVLTTMEAPDV